MGSTQYQPDYDTILELLSEIIQRVKPYKLNPKLVVDNRPLFELSLNDKKCLYCTEFWHIVFSNDGRQNWGVSPSAAGRILARMVYENLAFTEIVVNAILKGMSKTTLSQSKPYLIASMHLLSVEDSLQ